LPNEHRELPVAIDREPGDSIADGIGQVRLTRNLEGTLIDMADQITDERALPVLFNLIEHQGLVLGGSSAINIVRAMRLARDLGPARPSSPFSRTVASATSPSSSIRTSCARKTYRYRLG
jgi:cysteine synthase